MRLLHTSEWCTPWSPDQRETPPEPEPLTLPDGTQAWIRPIGVADRELHAANYERLSDDSKFNRFLSTVPRLSESQLDRLVDEVDGVDHIAYYLFLDAEESPLPVAIGRIVRDPDQPDAADVAVTVHDAWQGRGIGTALLRVLVARRPEGVTHLLTVVHVNNIGSLKMLRKIGPAQETPLGDGAMQVCIELAERAPQSPPKKQAVPSQIATWRKVLHTRDQLLDLF